jgi:hypothetical protein
MKAKERSGRRESKVLWGSTGKGWQALALVGLAVLLAWASPRSGAYAQTEDQTGWSEPVNLSNSPTQSNNPSLAADPAGGVHAVWSEDTGENEGQIWYARLEGDTWSKPIDVLLTPGGSLPTYPALAADAGGLLHVVWQGGGRIYYSQAFAADVQSAWAWTPAQPLVDSQNFLSAPDLCVGAQGETYVGYAATIGERSGIYVVRSPDGGAHWGQESLVYANPRDDRLVDKPRVEVGPDGMLHVVWAESAYPDTYPPLGIWYSSSADQGATWREPVLLAEGPYADPEIVTKAEHEVHVVWSGTGTDRFKFHSWSADNGQTWSFPWRNEALGGFQGLPALVSDGSGKLHWIQIGSLFGQIEPGVHLDHLFEQEWLGDRWTEGEVILSNADVGQNMAFVSGAVALGNELHVAIGVPLATSDGYQTDILVMHRTLEAESIAARELPTATPETGPVESEATTVQQVATATPTRTPLPAASAAQPRAANGGVPPLGVGVAATAVMCGLAAWAVALRGRR